MKTTIDFAAITYALWRKVFIIVPCGLAAGILTYFVASYLIQPIYVASVSVYLNNISEQEERSSIQNADITAANLLANTFVALLRDAAVLQEIADSYNEDIDALQIRNSISVSLVDNTSLVEIVVTADSPQKASKLCGSVAEIAPSIIFGIVKAGSAVQLGDVHTSSDSRSDDILKYSTIGFVLGLLSSSLIILIIFVIRDAVRGEEDLFEHYDVPFLSAVTYSRSPEKCKTISIDETYRVAGASLLLELQSYDSHVVMVSTSAFKNWEYSMIMLATAVAETGARVLIIDENYINASFFKKFIPNDSKVTLPYEHEENCNGRKLYHDVCKNFDIMLSDNSYGKSVQLLGSSMLKKVAEDYDLVLIVSSSASISSTIHLSHLSAGTLLLAMKNKTHHKDLRETLITLSTFKTKPIGILLADTSIRIKINENTPSVKNQ